MRALELVFLCGSVASLNEKHLKKTPGAFARITLIPSFAPPTTIRIQSNGNIILKTRSVGTNSTLEEYKDTQIQPEDESEDFFPRLFDWKNLKFLRPDQIDQNAREKERLKRRQIAKRNRWSRKWSQRLDKIPASWLETDTNNWNNVLEYEAQEKTPELLLNLIRETHGPEIIEPLDIMVLDGASVFFEYVERNIHYRLQDAMNPEEHPVHARLFDLFAKVRDQYFIKHKAEIQAAHSPLQKVPARTIFQALSKEPLHVWAYLYSCTPTSSVNEAIRMHPEEIQNEIFERAKSIEPNLTDIHREIELHIHRSIQ